VGILTVRLNVIRKYLCDNKTGMYLYVYSRYMWLCKCSIHMIIRQECSCVFTDIVCDCVKVIFI